MRPASGWELHALPPSNTHLASWGYVPPQHRSKDRPPAPSIPTGHPSSMAACFEQCSETLSATFAVPSVNVFPPHPHPSSCPPSSQIPEELELQASGECRISVGVLGVGIRGVTFLILWCVGGGSSDPNFHSGIAAISYTVIIILTFLYPLPHSALKSLQYVRASLRQLRNHSDLTGGSRCVCVSVSSPPPLPAQVPAMPVPSPSQLTPSHPPLNRPSFTSPPCNLLPHPFPLQDPQPCEHVHRYGMGVERV